MYIVMESDMKLNVCVDVMGNIQRPIYAFIEILPMTAEGTCLLVVVVFVYLFDVCSMSLDKV